MGAAAGFPISVTFTGDESLSSRPMERVLAPLRAMGARPKGSTLPVTIHGGGLHGIRFVNEKASAQVKSAILLAGLRASGKCRSRRAGAEPRPQREHAARFRLPRSRVQRRRDLARTPVALSRARDGGDPGRSVVGGIPDRCRAAGAGLARHSPRHAWSIRCARACSRRCGEMGADISLQNERVEGGEAVADVTVASFEPARGRGSRARARRQ